MSGRMKATQVLWMVLLAVLVLPALALSACAPEEAPVEVVEQPVQEPIDVVETAPEPAVAEPVLGPGELPLVDPLEVTGNIVAAGSSTVFPLSEAVAEMFQMDGYSGQITVDSIGSGAGFERFCSAGESDIANASRPIKDSELEKCRAIGREPIEFKMAIDALAVVVSVENDFVDDLTLEELAQVFGTAATWADVRPDWPDQPIQRFAPGTDSGTFDYFVEEVFDNDPAVHLAASPLQLSEDDNVLVKGVEGSPYAIGYFGYAYLAENPGRIRGLALEGVAPTAEAVEGGEYPLSRPLFLYTTAEIMRQKPQVAAFINYYLTNVYEAVAVVGYFPVPQDVLNAAMELWLEAVGQ
jgi:phosphate transport system substrate-binding protein